VLMNDYKLAVAEKIETELDNVCHSVSRYLPNNGERFRVMAVAAPHWISDCGGINIHSLDSRVPFSLLNAVRLAATHAEKGVGYWAQSNWRTQVGRNHSIQMLSYLSSEKEIFIRKLKEIQPHLLLIGSMSLSFPGAVALAKIAKDILQENVFVVLGGKHALETIYVKNGAVEHHPGSPLKLMKEYTIPRVFDLVIAGDGESIIAEIGEMLGRLIQHQMPIKKFYDVWDQLLIADGKWIAGRVENEKIATIQSWGNPIDYSQIMATTDLFATESHFDVFDTPATFHAHSYISKGCIHNCAFCSERVAVNGKASRPEQAPYNLLKDFMSIARKIGKGDSASIFVEDSILLNGNERHLEHFLKLLDLHDPHLSFGCQLTIDGLLKKSTQPVLKQLKEKGLEYIFWGLETGSDHIAKGLCKNNQKEAWLEKNARALQWIAENNLKCGVSVMFGLGESQINRCGLLRHLIEMAKKYGRPNVVSMNIATQHPLQGSDDGANYQYAEWGTSEESPCLPLYIELFGEASEKYLLPGIQPPTLCDLFEIKELYYEYKRVQNTAWQYQVKYRTKNRRHEVLSMSQQRMFDVVAEGCL